MSAQSVDLLIIGDGVSARALLWELGINSFPGTVLQVSSPNLFPKTSLKSTGLVTLHGMKSGVSPLGDVLVDGVQHFLSNVWGCGLMGLTKGRFVDTSEAHDDRLIRRYGAVSAFSQSSLASRFTTSDLLCSEEEAIFIEPRVFLSSLLEQYKYPYLEGDLVGVAGNKATFLDGREVIFSKIILASGVSLCELSGLGISDKRKISEVPGSYFHWSLNLGDESFGVGLGHSNLVYRSSDNALMLGGTTQKGEVITPDFLELESFYQSALKIAPWLPPKKEANFFTGVRVKGPKRVPLFEQIQKDVFILGAAYKNGWSQSFYGARKLVKELL